MNILFITNFFVGFMVSEIPRVSVFGHCSYSVTFPYREYIYIYIYIYILTLLANDAYTHRERSDFTSFSMLIPLSNDTNVK